MAGVFPRDEDAYRAAMARSVLRRIRRRQDALRRRWYELTREKVEAELLAIGRELVEAAPLFLPRAFDSGGKVTSSENEKTRSRNGRYDGAAERTGADLARRASDPRKARRRAGPSPGVGSSGREGREELLSAAERILDELEQLLTDLGGDEPTAGASR